MSAQRAFRVLLKGEVSGFLGEGAGPFITAVRSSLPPPRLPGARFTSRRAHDEAPISQALLQNADFDAALQALKAAGFELEAMSFFEAFGHGASA